jgi:hypothetical protein
MLKKMTLVCVAVVSGFAYQALAETTAVPAGTETKTVKAAAVTENSKVERAPIQIGFWFDVPGNTGRVPVNGFRFGFPFSGTSPVSGLDLSLFGSDVKGIDGAQISFGFCNSTVRSYGAQISVFACLNKIHFDGGQISLFNKAEISKGWQAGCLNLSNDVNGGQVGLTNIAEQIKGFQAGVVNVITRSRGPQIGLVNYGERSSFQLGLININKHSSMPFMILFNFSK